MWLFAESGFAQSLQPFVLGCDVFRQRKLVLTFGVYRLLPQVRPCARSKCEHRTGKDRIRRTIRRKHEADRFERFADDQRDAMFGRLEKKLAMNRSREAGD